MTRWAMVADLRRCVGCQTCTAACKHANATPPGVQWRRVIDMEFGEYPDVQRAFVPVGCQHCDDPPCLSVCPTTATKKRADGIVTIDYDLCIGCAYCAVACPYQARYKTERATFAYGAAERARGAAPRRRAAGGGDQVHLLRRSHRRRARQGPDPRRRPRGDAGLRERLHRRRAGIRRCRRSREQGVAPAGREPALPHARGAGHRARASSTCGTATTSAPTTGADAMSFGPNPWQQQSWDWRAAGNFICGGAGGGLIVCAALLNAPHGLLLCRRGVGRPRAGFGVAGDRPPVARDACLLQPAHARGCRARRSSRRCCSPRWLQRGSTCRSCRPWRPCWRAIFVFCQAPHPAGGQGHPGLA